MNLKKIFTQNVDGRPLWRWLVLPIFVFVVTNAALLAVYLNP